IFNWINIGTEVAIADKAIGRAVKDLIEDRRLVATNTPKSEMKSDLVR
ncbi:MAG: hypothetical protein JO298_11415, partial [Verrucomicrobia bacterium]|nr:hypothetical protein [Verrucomicrobiota bacterium]